MSYDIKKIMEQLAALPPQERLIKTQQLVEALKKAKKPMTLDEYINSKSPLADRDWESGMSFNDLLSYEELQKRNSLASGDHNQLLAKLARLEKESKE